MLASSILGKRTRSSRGAEPETLQELPAKRPRRLTRKIDAHEDKENQEIEPAFESIASAETAPPKRLLSRQLSISGTNKRPVVAPITPSTPRHYDVFATTPSTRHRVMSVGKFSRRLTPLTPATPSSSQTIYHKAKQLFSRSADPGQLIGRDEERGQLRQFLERCSTSSPGGCIYVSGPPGTGKSAMVKEVTDQTASQETASIRKAYINCMSIKSSKDLYNTLLEQLCDETDEAESDAVATLQRIFTPKKRSSGGAYLVVLDEIDHILTLDLESLYRVFEWSLQKNSRLALVGIANALDLTDRFLPRLKSRNLKPELLPVLPYTAPQVKKIIISRLKGLLPENTTATPDFIPFFHPAAIELCSRKVSTQTGDLRRAFEICRRAIDLVETETRTKAENEAKEEILQMTPSKKAVLGENNNLSSGGRPGPASVPQMVQKALQSLTVENAPRVSIAHLNKVTAAAFSHGTNQRLKTLNLQQKAALCALVAIERRNRTARNAAASTPSSSSIGSTPSSRSATPTSSSKASVRITAPTIKTLFDAYCLLCTRDSVLHPLSSSEFREVVGSLETLSLVAPVDGKTGSFGSSSPSSVLLLGTPGSGRKGRKRAGVAGAADEKRVASCVGEKEIETAVEGLGEGILRSILSGEALDD